MPDNKKQGKKTGSTGYTAYAYQLNQRRIKVWIPFLERKVAELKARIRDRQAQEDQGD